MKDKKLIQIYDNCDNELMLALTNIETDEILKVLSDMDGQYPDEVENRLSDYAEKNKLSFERVYIEDEVYL